MNTVHEEEIIKATSELLKSNASKFQRKHEDKSKMLKQTKEKQVFFDERKHKAINALARKVNNFYSLPKE